MITNHMENQRQYSVHVHGPLDLFKELIKVSGFRHTERSCMKADHRLWVIPQYFARCGIYI